MAVSLLSLNGSRGAGLHPQQVWDWLMASLVKVQSGDPLHVSDSRLMEPHEVLDPLRFSFHTLSTPNTHTHTQSSANHNEAQFVTIHLLFSVPHLISKFKCCIWIFFALEQKHHPPAPEGLVQTSQTRPSHHHHHHHQTIHVLLSILRLSNLIRLLKVPSYLWRTRSGFHGISYSAALGVVRSVRQQEGDSLQLAVAGGHRLSRVPAAGQHSEVVRRDGDVSAEHQPRGGENKTVPEWAHATWCELYPSPFGVLHDC